MKELDKQKGGAPISAAKIHRENRVHHILVRLLLVVMAVEWVILLVDQR
jgi:hypothetical protein